MRIAEYWEIEDEYTLKCKLCSHYCTIKLDKFGICQLRQNIDNVLYTHSYGKISGWAVDPIEKKPLFHFKPGSSVFSFGTPGCNFQCLNCQNDHLSQVVRIKGIDAINNKTITPEQILAIVKQTYSNGIAYTYSEPTIFFEYAKDIIQLSKTIYETKNLFHVFVSNGFMSQECLKDIIDQNLIQAINIDLKFTNEKKYKEICGAHLKPVLENIKYIAEHSDKIFLEITNLIIPGQNDSKKDFQEISEFLAKINPDIPLHFSRFYPNYKMMDTPPTSLDTLITAKKIAEEVGLNYVYIGNTLLKNVEDTYCPSCKTLLISRNRYSIISNVFTKITDKRKPSCPRCGYKINIIL